MDPLDCQAFQQRLDQNLDQRNAPECDPLMRRHADRCVSCQQKLEAWIAIDQFCVNDATNADRLSVDLPTKSSPSRSTGRWRWVIAIAASMGAMLLIRPELMRPGVSQPAGEALAKVESSPSRGASGLLDNIDPVIWWRDVQKKDWIGDTMPAVQSMADGVAPIGRSLRRAVTMLTTGSTEQTS